MGVAVTLYFVVGLTQRLRRGEVELLRANEEIRRFSEMQRNYLHLAIHDVKAPVGAAQTFLNNLEEGLAEPLGPMQAAMVGGAQRRLSGLSQLLRDFEVLAALDTVELDRQEHVLHAAEMVRNVVRDNQDLAQMHHHELRAEIPGDLPPIPGIERLLSECVSNLLTNAIKYTPDGGKITVRAVLRGSWIRFEVQDNGIGIEPADQKRLFRDFVRIRRKDTGLPAREGSGLGLSIVRRIAEMHGGRAGVQSELNKGSTFFIELPLL
jgi:signal transduction histidine kinase